ncbi:unnamed protein product, partial [marine sediment metagenome]
IQHSDVQKTGITIYDRDTSTPYCVYVASGVLQTSAGECQSATTTIILNDATYDDTPPETIIDTHPLPATTFLEAEFAFHSSDR